MPLSRSNVLFYLDANHPRSPAPLVGGDVTFVRDTAATHRDEQGRLRSLGAKIPRHVWATVDGDSRAALLLEPAGIELLAGGEDFTHSAWVPSNGATVTPDTHVAPDGTRTADTVTDTGASFAALTQDIPAGPDEVFAFSIWLRRDPTATRAPEFGLDFQGGSTPRINRVQVDPVTGALHSRFQQSGISEPRVERAGDYWRVSLLASNNASGNTIVRVFITPVLGALGGVDGNGTGSVVLWGARLVKLPSITSDIRGGAGTVRGSEQVRWGSAPQPQAMAVFVDFIKGYAADRYNGRIFQIGKADNTGPWHFVDWFGGMRWALHNGTAASLGTLALGTSEADRVRVVSLLHSDGSGRLIAARGEDAVSALGIGAPGGGLPTGWSEDTLHLNSVGTTAMGAMRVLRVTVARLADLTATTDQGRWDELNAFYGDV